MENDTIDLNQTPQPETIDLGNTPGVSIVPDFIAKNQANKYHQGLGDDSPGRDELKNSITNGTEDYQRQQALVRQQVKDASVRQDLIGQITNNRNMSPEDYQLVTALSDGQLIKAAQSPKTFFEEQYAKSLVNDQKPDGNFQQALGESAPVAHAIADATESAITHKEIAQKIEESGMAQFGGEDLLSKGLAYAETFVPFWSWNAIDASQPGGPNHDVSLPGTEAENSYTYLLGIKDPERFRQETQATFDSMYARSPTDALTWIQGLTGFSTSDKYLQNFVGLTDLGTLAGGLVKAGGFGLKSAALAASSKDLIQAAGTRTFRPAAIMIAKGDVRGAALQLATSKVIAKANATAQMGTVEDLMGELNPLFNPMAALGQDGTTLATEATQRNIQALETSSAGMLSSLTDKLPINRLEDYQLAAGIQRTQDAFNHQYPELSDFVMGVEPIASADTLQGVDMLGVNIGTKNALPYKSRAAAVAGARRLKLLGNSAPVQRGDGNWFIQVAKPVNETDDAVRDLPVPTAFQTPRSLVNLLFGLVRSNQDTLNPKLMEAYNVAAFGSTSFMEHVQTTGRAIGTLRKQSRNDLNSYLQANRVFHDPRTGQIGRFAPSQGAFEREWLDFHGRPPSEKESLAYWSYRQLNDYGFVTYNLSLLRDKQRLGLETFSFPFKDPAWAANGPDNPITARTLMRPISQTTHFEGKYIKGGVDGIDWNNAEDTGIMIHDRDLSQVKTYRKKFHNAAELKSKIGEGQWHLIQMSPEGKRMMREEPAFHNALPESDFSYVLTREYKTKPLQWKQLPYRPGGVIEFPDGWFVRQPNIMAVTKEGATEAHQHYYRGDVNVSMQQTESDAKDWASKMEQARKLFQANDASLPSYLEHNLPFDTEEFYKLWKSDSNPEALLDRNTPIYATPKGKSVEDFHKISDQYTNLVDARKSSYNLYSQVNLQHAMSRNDPIYTFMKTGDPAAPIYDMKPAQMLDPIASTNRSAAALMRGRFLEDLKFKTAENFIAEFSGMLKTPLEEMKANPLKHLLDPQWAQGVDRTTLAAAKNYRRAAVNFLGLKNDFQKNTRWMKQKLADFVFQSTGEKGFKLVEPYLLHRTKDPVSFFRNAAFHSFLGVFNPVQLFLQAQTVAHTAAIEGFGRAYQGLSAAVIQRVLSMSDESPAMLKAAALRARPFGWTEEHFLESYQGLKDSGFGHVGGEHAARDDLLDQSAIRSGFAEFLHKGTVFFREGEGLTRRTAWNAAYKRWRSANPQSAFDDVAKKSVLQRADLLNVNMSNASQAAWNKGFASVPTQFLPYQARMTEQFLGKRLTLAEKSRAMLTYSALYGLPVGVGIPTLGLNPFSGNPLNDDIRQTLLEKGIDYDENVVSKTLMDGILSMAFEYSTGTKYNVGARYGPNGTSMLKDIISGDKTVVDTLLGASGTTIGNMLGSFEPFTMLLAQGVATGDVTGKDIITVGAHDLARFAKNISAVNNTYKAYYGIGLGKLITKSGVEVDDVTGWEGFNSALFGLSPQRVDDMYLMQGSDHQRAQAQDSAKVKINEMYDKAIKSFKDGQDEDGAEYIRLAYMWVHAGQFREDQIAGVFRDALKNKTMTLSVAQQFAKGDPARMELILKSLTRGQQ